MIYRNTNTSKWRRAALAAAIGLVGFIGWAIPIHADDSLNDLKRRQTALQAKITELQHKVDGQQDPDVKAHNQALLDKAGSMLKDLQGQIDTLERAGANPSGDSSVVDARKVPSGLPQAVDIAIAKAFADAPPEVADRVRKGFQAVMSHDWKVAKAWFQDALNRDPANAGLQRLVDLAQYTLEKKNPPAPVIPPPADEKTAKTLAALTTITDEKLNEDLNRALDDFYRNYLPKHPELTHPDPTPAVKDPAPKPADEAPKKVPSTPDWQQKMIKLFAPPKQPSQPGSVAAPRG